MQYLATCVDTGARGARRLDGACLARALLPPLAVSQVSFQLASQLVQVLQRPDLQFCRRGFRPAQERLAKLDLAEVTRCQALLAAFLTALFHDLFEQGQSIAFGFFAHIFYGFFLGFLSGRSIQAGGVPALFQEAASLSVRHRSGSGPGGTHWQDF